MPKVPGYGMHITGYSAKQPVPSRQAVALQRKWRASIADFVAARGMRHKGALDTVDGLTNQREADCQSADSQS